MEIQTADVGTGFSSLSRVKTCGTAYHGDIGLPTCPGDAFFHFLVNVMENFASGSPDHLEVPVDADLGYFGLLLAANS